VADEIQNDPNAPKTVAVLTIAMVDHGNGNYSINLQSTGNFNEVNARFMMSKVAALLDDHWRVANMPKVVPGNGGSLMSPQLRRLIG
jgi:hypothetical protein